MFKNKFVLFWMRKYFAFLFISAVVIFGGLYLMVGWDLMVPIERGLTALAIGFFTWLGVAVGQDQPIVYLKSLLKWPNAIELLIWGGLFVMLFILSQVSPWGGTIMIMIMMIELWREGEFIHRPSA